MTYVLIARKNGQASTRRQRRFGTLDHVQRAVGRWSREGFNTWWLATPTNYPVYLGYGPTPDVPLKDAARRLRSERAVQLPRPVNPDVQP